jgi:hypothetical protein
VLAVPENLHAVDEDMLDTDGILMRLLICRAIHDGRWVKDNHVREHSLFNEAAPVKSQIGCGQTRQAAHRFLKRDHFFLAHVFAKETREVAVGARVS